MKQAELQAIFTQEFCDTLLPPERSDQFFEALYGDASEGAYDIRLEPLSANTDRVVLAFNLVQRPGKCLVCSLTYGLPTVFQRHPLINLNGMIQAIKDAGVPVKNWQLGATEEDTQTLHVVPLYIDLA